MVQALRALRLLKTCLLSRTTRYAGIKDLPIIKFNPLCGYFHVHAFALLLPAYFTCEAGYTYL
jgi:hypothetical protein